MTIVRFKYNHYGFTLIEAITGLVIFVIVALPASQYLSRLCTSSRVRDMQCAAALLKGEIDILYANRAFPGKEREIDSGGRKYTILFSHEPDTGLVTWKMGVKSGGRHITHVSGMLYVDAGCAAGYGE